MRKTPKISIVIPSYNSVKTLSATLKSIFKQSFEDFEIVIVDDGSTDNTAKVVQDWQEKEAIIKYVYQENKGLAGARNQGIRNASGEYILFLDADDVIKPNHLKSLYKKSLSFNKQKKIAFSDTLFWVGTKILKRSYGDIAGYKQGESTEKFLAINYMPGVHSILFPCSAIKTAGFFDQTLVGAEDHDLYIRIALAGWRFYSTDQATAIYRVAPGSMSFGRKQVERIARARIQIAKKYLAKKTSKEVKKALYEKLQLAYIELGRYWLREGNRKKAINFFNKAEKVPTIMPTKKRIMIWTSKIIPIIPLTFWNIKDRLIQPELKQAIDRNLGTQAYEQ